MNEINTNTKIISTLKLNIMKNRSENKLNNTDKNLIILSGLKEATKHIIEQLNTKAYKLASINDKNNVMVKRESSKYYRKVMKLKSIAIELIEGIEKFSYKLQRSATLVAERNNQKNAIERFSDELSLLNEMTFNTAKMVFPFVLKEYNAKVFTLRTNMAA